MAEYETQQRRVLLDYLKEHPDRGFSIEELYDALASCCPSEQLPGKSTLYRLILATYRPQSGEVILETDKGNYPCSAASRRFFGFVPQTPTLFSGTLRPIAL